MKTKRQLKIEVINLISKMENNTFLFPKSWSDRIDMINEDWSYKTYNSGSIGNNRFHNFEIHKEGKKQLDIHFRGDKIVIEQDLAKKQVNLKDVHYYISTIYNELHSFKNHSEGRRKIRKEINILLTKIDESKNKIIILKNRLKDSKEKLQ